jgi:hypothetical protein
MKWLKLWKKIILPLGIIGLILWWFFLLSSYNYKISREIKEKIVRHPEDLPKPHIAKLTSFGFQNVRADWYRLQTIQYIGGNAIWAEYKKYLYRVLELITTLNPYFDRPYTIGQLLLPSYSDRYENLSKEEQERNIKEWEKLGLLGVNRFCDMTKVDAIKKEYNLFKLWNSEKYKNPCKHYEVPFYLAYIYFYYIKDPLKASLYYKVASANTDAPEWAKIMSAIMQWKWGEREKSLFMFLSLARSLKNNDEVCTTFIGELENIAGGIVSKKIKVDETLVQKLEETQIKVFWPFDEKKELEILWDTNCQNYVHKSIREINLMYIEEANERFKKDHKNGLPARNAKWLFEEAYIKFLPTDYQQYEGYGIIYEYNEELKRFDYQMGNYR